MKVTYHPDVDILWIRLRNEVTFGSDENPPGYVTDFNEKGEILGYEIHDASKRVDLPLAPLVETVRG